MRIARKFGLVLAAVIVPSWTLAQQASNDRNSFDNSWYWGAKGGSTSFDAGGGRVTAPTFGAEWLITRSHGALYISADQSYFDEVGGVFDASAAGSVRAVNIADMRRYTIGLLAYPVTWGELRPYAGLGFALNVIQNADPQGTFLNQASQNTVFQRVHEQTSRASAILTAGAQVQIGRVALFGQASSMPTRDNFLFSGSNYTFVFEGGLRFNLASAIADLR